MALRPLLAHIADDDTALALARDGGRAFVSASLRPYLIAALLDGGGAAADGSRPPALAGDRPALVVAGDDRAARDLAADLRAWLAPRPVRFYPSRGVAYESHLAPPPHLVGLRVAALDALLAYGSDAANERGSAAAPGTADSPVDGEAPVIVVSATALSEKVPDPALRPHSFWLRVGDVLDLDEVANELVAAGYERVEQVEDRGQFAVRGGLLDVFPATEERAVRVDLFDIEIDSMRWFSTFTQRSLGDARGGRDRSGRRAGGRASRAGRDRRVAGRGGWRAPRRRRAAPGRALRRAARSRAGRGGDRRGRRGGDRARARRPVGRRHGRLPRHRRAPPLRQARRHQRRAARTRAGVAVVDLRRPAVRVPRPDGRHRGQDGPRRGARAGEARALGVPHRRRLPAPGRGRARRLQPRPPEGDVARRG